MVASSTTGAGSHVFAPPPPSSSSSSLMITATKRRGAVAADEVADDGAKSKLYSIFCFCLLQFFFFSPTIFAVGSAVDRQNKHLRKPLQPVYFQT